MSPRLHRFPSSSLLIETLCERIVTLAHDSIERQGYFGIVLAGGSTPRKLYEKLRSTPNDWRYWHIYFGDERNLPAGHPERNDSMAAAAWLDHVPIPSSQVHRIPYSVSLDTAATSYDAMLAQTPDFDLVLLGLGEDGHTASLFPGRGQNDSDTALALAIPNAPKPPPQRVSMSARCLSRAKAVWFMVTGNSKLKALEAWLDGGADGAALPPRLIQPRSGVDIFTDLALERFARDS